MLKLEDKELKKVTEFLSLMGTDFNSLDYVEKNNVFYNAKTKETINDLLTNILMNYKGVSDLHFYYEGQQTIKLRVRLHGNLINTAITMSAQDNYKTAHVNNSILNAEVFKELFDKIIGLSSIQNGQSHNFVKELTIPIFGNYRIRSSASGHDGIARILRLSDNYFDTINYNLIQIKNNPIYTIEAELKNGNLIHHDSIQLTTEIKNKIDLYESKLNSMFHTFKSKLNIYKHEKLKIVLEYIGNNIINVSITNNYRITRYELDTNILSYVLDNYQDFYDPIFTHFIEDVTQTKFDPTIGEFKTPEAFKDYLTTLDMVKI